jgi:RHS repeat-associated protein
VGITYPDNTTSTFRYDPAGHRVEVTDGTLTSRYAYDQQAIAAEYDKTNSLVSSFVHDPASPTRTFEMNQAGQRYFYLSDAQGSTTALTTITGATANAYTYDAFGTSVQTGSVANPFTFTGQLFDRSAGLYLFPLRAYDPALGRFLSEDPDFAINPYPYVENDPVNLLDPTGASVGSCVRGAVLAAALVAGAMNSYPGGSEFAQNVGKCAIKILEAYEKRAKLAELATKAQLVQRK